MKKFLVAVLSLALALSVVAPVAASAQSMSSAYAFNTSLKVGSRGADVVALQSFLEMKGLLVMPFGVAKGYFGTLTRNAVSAYQVMKNISPTAGYFGPITRQAVMAEMAGSVAVTTCPAGFTCTSTTPVVNTTCPAGFTCTPVTVTTTPTTSGVEGSLTVTLAASPANNANIQTSSDVPVYGIEFKGKIADSVVQTVDLQVAVVLASDSSAENPATLINTVKVWDGSTVIATIPVTSTTFTKDSNSVYYIRLSGLNFLVPKDATKVLTISFSTNSIDSNRTVTLDGYGSSSVRAVSGNNISSFYSIDGSAYTRTHTFKKPGSSTLTLTAASSPLRSQNFRVGTTDTVIVPTLNFNVKSETGASNITTVVATSTYSGTATDLVFYLYDGSTLLSSKTGSTSVSFDNLNVAVGQDVTKTLSVKIGFPATSSTGVVQVATTSVTSVSYEKPSGSTASVTTVVNGVGQYVYSAAPQFVLATAPTIVISGSNSTTGTSSGMTASFKFNVTALGASVNQATSTSFTVVFATSSTNTFAAGTTQVVTIPNSNISEGSTATVEVTAAIDDSALTHGGLYTAAITAINWTAGSNTVNQTYGLDDFKTSSAANFNK